MTKIVLVNTPLTGKERYGILSAAGVYMPPLGLAGLAAFIRLHGYPVKIVDCCALNLSIVDSAKAILSFKPEYVGITAATISINNAAILASILKQQSPNLKIIVGGSHLSALPEKTMKVFPQFDIGIIGEGELTVIELLKTQDEKISLDGLKGIIFRDNGKLKINEQRPLINNLDALPFPAWDLLPDLAKFYRPSCFGFKKMPVTNLVTSRGCPMRCTFCSKIPFARTHRMHSIPYIIGMIKFLKQQYRINDLMIYDEFFCITKQRLTDFCESMIKENIDMVWSCDARVDSLAPETLKLMKRAGCWLIGYGIESGSQEILNFTQKDINLRKAKEVLEWTKKEGILTKGYFMLGHLKDNEESIRSTLNFILNSKLDVLTLNYFTPLPGSLDYERASCYGEFNNNWSLLNQHNLVFIPFGLDRKAMDFYRKYIVRRFYLRPGIILRYAKMLFNIRSFEIIVLGFIVFLNFLRKRK